MSGRSSWAPVKAARPVTVERAEAYERAGRGVELGRQLFDLRERRGMSQRDLGRLAGVRPSVIDAIEVGSIEGHLDEVDRLCDALGISMELRLVMTPAAAAT